MGKRDRGKWSATCQADRGNKKRTFTLTPEVHEALNKDAEALANLSDIADEALRRYYGLRGKGPRGKRLVRQERGEENVA